MINTDAHSILELDNIRYGVFAARRAGLSREEVLNARPYAQFQERLRKPSHAVSVPVVAAMAGSPVGKIPAKAKATPAATPGAPRKTSAPSEASARKAGKKPVRRP